MGSYENCTPQQFNPQTKNVNKVIYKMPIKITWLNQFQHDDLYQFYYLSYARLLKTFRNDNNLLYLFFAGILAMPKLRKCEIKIEIKYINFGAAKKPLVSLGKKLEKMTAKNRESRAKNKAISWRQSQHLSKDIIIKITTIPREQRAVRLPGTAWLLHIFYRFLPPASYWRRAGLRRGRGPIYETIQKIRGSVFRSVICRSNFVLFLFLVKLLYHDSKNIK